MKPALRHVVLLACGLALGASGCGGNSVSSDDPPAGDDPASTDSDGDGDGDASTANQAPTATPPSAVVVSEDAFTLVSLTGSDAEDGEAQLTVTVTSAPAHGGLDVTSGAAPLVVRYTPAAGYAGSDSFSFVVRDSGGASSGAATVAVTVTPAPDAPVAESDAATTSEDTAVSIGVLANDHDEDGDALVIESVATPSSGSAVIAGDLITFTPAADEAGVATFSYVLGDGTGRRATGQVSVTVTPVNDEPTTTPLSTVTIDEDTSAALVLTGTDVEDSEADLTVMIVTPPLHGQLSATSGDAPLSVTYTPHADYAGSDSFSFRVWDADGLGASVAPTVSIVVTPVNDPPVANDDQLWVAMDTTKSLPVLVNDVEDGVLTITSVTQPASGAVTFTAGSVTFTPLSGFSGTTTFTYSVTDGTTSDSATVTVRVVADAWQGLGGSDVLANGGVSNNTTLSSLPSIAVDGQGHPIVAWMNGAGDTEIYVRRWDGGAWVELGAGSASGGGISDNAGVSTDPAIALDSKGNPIVAWSDDSATDDEIFVRRWNGAAWGPVANISNNLGRSSNPEITCDALDRCVIVWDDESPGDHEIYLRRWDLSTNTFSSLTATSALMGGISDNSGDSTNPVVVVTSSGDPIVAWTDTSSSSDQLYLKRWNGTWAQLASSASSGGITRATVGYYGGRPGLTLYGGEPLVAWSEYSNGDDDLFALRWSGSSWVAFGGTGAGGISQTGTAGSPLLASHPSGDPIMAWTDGADGDREIYVRRWGGSSWDELHAGSASGGGVSNDAVDSWEPDLAVGADGTVCVTWFSIVSPQSEILVRCTP